jgi:uncharacterized membrane protein
MFQNLKKLYGRKLGAVDGDIGHVKDFYFHDKTWRIRYVVADTGSWLPGRLVLLAPDAFGTHAFGKADADTGVLRLNLTQKQIENSPSIGSHQLVSRHYEEEYYRYYGWPSYWDAGGISGLASFPLVIPPATPENVAQPVPNQRDDIHLRSTRAVTGYQIHATDGTIGSVVNFMIHERTWAIRELVVEIGHWYAAKEVLVLPENINRISYEESEVFVNLTKENIHLTARNDVAQAGAGHL